MVAMVAMVVFVGYAQKNEFSQQIWPFFHRYAKSWSSCAIFVSVVLYLKCKTSHAHALLRFFVYCTFYGVCLNSAESYISQAILVLIVDLARFPMPTRGGVCIPHCYACPYARNQNGTCHLGLMALLVAPTANYGEGLILRTSARANEFL